MSDRTFLGAWQAAIEAKTADAPSWMSKDGKMLWAKSAVAKERPELRAAVEQEANHNARTLKNQRKSTFEAQRDASKW